MNKVLVSFLLMGFSCSAFAAVQQQNWTDTVKLSGDVRFRHETIAQEFTDIRNRQRVRARVGVFAQPANHFLLGLSLASGNSDPISSSQSLDDAFSTKPIGIDLAYVQWVPSKSFDVVLGKQKNPFFSPSKSELIWDTDLRPETLTVRYINSTPLAKMKWVTSGFMVEERSDAAETWMLGNQATVQFPLGTPKARLTLGGSYYHYTNGQGLSTFVADDESFGNSVFTNQSYANSFHLLEGFSQVDVFVFDLPVAFYLDYVNNQAAEADNQAWLLGFKVGRITKNSDFDFKYSYRVVQKDAVVGAFTDSDFLGGGTDGRGHEFGLGYQVAKGVKANLSYFLNSRDLAQNVRYQRAQVDLSVKF